VLPRSIVHLQERLEDSESIDQNLMNHYNEGSLIENQQISVMQSNSLLQTGSQQ